DLVVNTGGNLSADSDPRVLDDFDELIHVPGLFVLEPNDFFSPQAENQATYLRSPSQVKHRHEHDLDDNALVRRHERATAQPADTGGGWHFLDKAEASLSVKVTRIVFCGLGDAHIDRDDIRWSSGTPGQGRLDYPRFDPEAGLRVGVTHAPYSRTLAAFASA